MTCCATGCTKRLIHTGTAAYVPNTIDGNQPFVAAESDGGYVQTPRVIEGKAVRAAPISFDDHFTQATLFYRSMTPVEQSHIVEAYTFELGKVLRAGDQGTRSGRAGQHRRGTLPPGRRRTRPAGTERGPGG